MAASLAASTGYILQSLREGEATALVHRRVAFVAAFDRSIGALRRLWVDLLGRNGTYASPAFQVNRQARPLSPTALRSLLVFGVLFAHSLPEGFAIGSAFASTEAGIGLFVIIAIAIQNLPEGTATATAMQPAGYSARRRFWRGVSSAPQVPGALVAWVAVEQIEGLLPVPLALAGGADAGARRHRPAARRVAARLARRERLAEASRDLDLLICGSRGRGRPVAALLGSVSTHLVTQAQCPVLVVPPTVTRSDGGPLGVTSASANG